LFGTAGVALAEANHGNSPPSVTIEDMQKKIEALGYDLLRVRVDDGVFKAQIVERQNGGAVTARFDVASGELIRAKLAH
jgi:hypothetical protein